MFTILVAVALVAPTLQQQVLVAQVVGLTALQVQLAAEQIILEVAVVQVVETVAETLPIKVAQADQE
jgi:hypothetical protein